MDGKKSVRVFDRRASWVPRWESIGFSGEVDPPLDGHKIESGSMVALRCKRGETGLSHLVHLTERVLVIHR